MAEWSEQISLFMSLDIFSLKVGDLVFAGIAVAAGFVLKAVSGMIFRRLERILKKNQMVLDDVLIHAFDKPTGWGLVLAGFAVAAGILPIPDEPYPLNGYLFNFYKGLSILLVVWVTIRFTNGLCDIWYARAQQTESKLDDQVIPIIRRLAKIFLVFLGGALFLQNLGYSIGSLLAGLGLGGAAVALASKDSLSNLFGGMVIFYDRLFQIGDWIEIEGVDGVVEEVGLRSIKIRTFNNSLVTIPNSKMSTANINNWSQMQRRRIRFSISLTYDANAQQIESVVASIRQLIEQTEDLHKENVVVNFDAFGSSGLEILVQAFSKKTDYPSYMETKQAFLLGVMRCVEKQGLDFAFPTRTLHVASLPKDTGKVPV